ncbi:MAG TPA: shikimate dehydrogenase, partial [Chthoniobacterales bacterium]
AHCEIPLHYAGFEIAPNDLKAALLLTAEREFVGLNITIPHKRAAAMLCDELDGFAAAIGAVNCLRFDHGKLIGRNTDGPGFARAIAEEFGVELGGLRVLLLGAGGGAGRAIAHECARARCAKLVLANRDETKARDLAQQLAAEAIRWSDDAFASALAEVDLVVNATPLGMKDTDEPLIDATLLRRDLLVYDIIYEPVRTRLLDDAANAGARIGNGLSMLLHQGALSFEQWFDRAAPIDVMRAALA